MPLHRFVVGNNTYNLHDKKLGSYSDNFGDIVTRHTRLPGVDGGFDEYLSGVAAREVGTVRQALTLMSTTKAGLDDLKDTLRETLAWGKGWLYFRPSDYDGSSNPERRVRARVSNIQMPKNEGDARNLYWQRVTIIFQCTEPAWESETEQISTTNHSGTSTTNTIPMLGSGIAFPVIEVATLSAQVLTQPWAIQRLEGTTVLDELEYTFTLPSGQAVTVTFDCRDNSVVYDNGTPTEGYSDTLVNFEHPDWFRLVHGNNSIKVVSGDSGDAAQVTVTWRDVWF